MVALIQPHYPKGEGGRPAYPLMAMLHVHLIQNWFSYSDPTMEEALYETTILRQFTGLSLERIPNETTILNFRRLLEQHELTAGVLAMINGYLGDRGLSLREGAIVDATLIHTPSSAKNKDGKLDPEMHQTKKGNQYYFGMKAHIGVDDASGGAQRSGYGGQRCGRYSGRQIAARRRNVVCTDAGYGVEKRPEHAVRGYPQATRTDQGPVFTGKALDQCAYQRDIKLKLIQPGKPTQNAFIESFNGKFWDECLNEHWFYSQAEARVQITACRWDYNEHRPHSTIGNLTPAEFAASRRTHQQQLKQEKLISTP